MRIPPVLHSALAYFRPEQNLLPSSDAAFERAIAARPPILKHNPASDHASHDAIPASAETENLGIFEFYSKESPDQLTQEAVFNQADYSHLETDMTPQTFEAQITAFTRSPIPDLTLTDPRAPQRITLRSTASAPPTVTDNNLSHFRQYLDATRTQITPERLGLSVRENSALPNLQTQLDMRDKYKEASGKNPNLKSQLNAEIAALETKNPEFKDVDAVLEQEVKTLKEKGKLNGDDNFAHALIVLHDAAHAFDPNHSKDQHTSRALDTLLHKRQNNNAGRRLMIDDIQAPVLDYIEYRMLKSAVS